MTEHSWTQPICDGCWEERNPGRAACRLRTAKREPEACCHCGAPTQAGIYVRVDPVTVMHPTLKKAN